jgi:integrase
MEEPMRLVARLLYGSGMRLMEALRLRVKDVDFDKRAIIVREAKGNKDRVVMLPSSMQEELRTQVRVARALWESDRAARRPDQVSTLEATFDAVYRRGLSLAETSAAPVKTYH